MKKCKLYCTCIKILSGENKFIIPCFQTTITLSQKNVKIIQYKPNTVFKMIKLI